MLKELSEDLSSIKKIQSEMKDSLIEIKNNLQGNNSRLDGAKNQINDLEHKEVKTTMQKSKRKKESKRMKIVYAATGTTSRGPTFASKGCQKQKRKSKKLEICLKK